MLIIEFVGLPGSGKSTIVNQVVKKCREIEIDIVQPGSEIINETSRVIRNIKKLNPSLKYLIDNQKQSYEFIKGIRKNNIKSIRDHYKMIYYYIFIASMIHKAKVCPKINFLDEGMFQVLWAINFLSKDNNWTYLLEKVVRYDLLPDIIFLVEADKEEVFDRLDKRNSGKLVTNLKKGGSELERRLNSKNLNKAYGVYAEAKRNILSLSEKTEKLEVFQITNNEIDDLNENVEKIKQIIMHHVNKNI
ncbi:AAA family ATPase [Crassaminicella profunda]|uniref:AAA family ATPase n=1 Tax=Crassaminicella profunda TaxID=1286698 RepID=UPI001CA752F2|nr:AAA family ATPase [Crassaminicella profunda]QZY55340.1 AAA family ATPase [Crassaminicella profunda]